MKDSLNDMLDLTLNNSKFTIFDIETTGLKVLDGDEIIAISALTIENDKVIDKFSEFIKPMQKIPNHITKLTGIDNNTVKDADSIEEVLPRFLNFLGDNIVVAHNGNFDVGFLEFYTDSILNDTFDNQLIDTLKLSRYLYPKNNKHKLNILCDFLGVKQIQHHNADDDTRVLCECFIKMKKEIYLRHGKKISNMKDNLLFKVDDFKKDSNKNILIFITDKGVLFYDLKSKRWFKHKNFQLKCNSNLIEQTIISNCKGKYNNFLDIVEKWA